MLLCALGDLLLDVIVLLRAELAPGADTDASTRAGAGGQAANVAAWAVALGGAARFVGRSGADEAGSLVRSELEARGVQLAGPPPEGRNGVVVALVDTSGERTMLSDRGVAPTLRAEELDMRWFRDCDVLHLPSYSLVRGPIDEAAAKAAGAVRARGGLVSADLSSWSEIRTFGAERLRRRLEILEPDVIFANEAEEQELGGDLPAPTVVLKRGAAGCLVRHGTEVERFDAVPADVVDSTGAGDAFAAGFLVGGVELAREAAARCVSRPGAMP